MSEDHDEKPPVLAKRPAGYAESRNVLVLHIEQRTLERQAGQTMFAAAILATRERADELGRRVAEADDAHRTARALYAAAEEALATTRDELQALNARREELVQVFEAARAWHERVRDAFASARAGKARRRARRRSCDFGKRGRTAQRGRGAAGPAA